MNNYIKTDIYLLMVALFDDSYLNEILLGLTSISMGQVTLIDAVSGTENLSQSIPMFAEFAGMRGKKFCKILFSAVSEEKPASRLINELNEAGLDFVGLSIGEIYAIKTSEAVLIEDI